MIAFIVLDQNQFKTQITLNDLMAILDLFPSNPLLFNSTVIYLENQTYIFQILVM